MLINGKEHKRHHSAYALGYHTVKGSTWERYNGRFGKGYKEHSNNPKSTRYHIVTYRIEIPKKSGKENTK